MLLVISLVINRDANVVKPYSSREMLLAGRMFIKRDATYKREPGLKKAVILFALVAVFAACEKQPDMDSVLTAVENGQSSWIESLLESGFDANRTDEEGVSLLMMAAKAGDTKLVDNLIERGVNVNHRTDKGITALMIAAKAGNSDIVQILLNEDAETHPTTVHGWTAINLAARYGDGETLAALEMHTVPRQQLLAGQK